MSIKIWKHRPVYTAVVEILEKKGSLTDFELYGILKESYGNLEFGKLNNALMKMEINI